MKLRLSALALGTTLLVGCASSGTDQQGRSDPLEGFNRTMYNFNFNVLDPYIVRPVAVAWRDYVPQPARNGLSNFTGNLEEPAVMVNYFLQGDPYQGMVHFTRFFLNTILGMGGFMAWVMGLTFSYRSTVASRCVMTVVIWRMVFTRFFPG